MRAIWVLIGVAALAGCSNDPQLHNISSGQTTPDEFAILPTRPLSMPQDLNQLPQPTPGGPNITDPNPKGDAVAALGGDPQRLQPSEWAGWGQLVVGGMVIFVAYEGFELIANAAGDVRDPQRNLPRAFYGCVIFVIILYILVAMVTVGGVAEEVILREKDYALAAAARPSLGQVGFVMVAVSALLATFSAINATVYGNARLGYGLAKDGQLPAKLDETRAGNPIDGVIVTAALSLVIANTVDLNAIAILSSAGFLLIFAMVCAAAWKLAPQIGARRGIAGVGFLACAGALVALLRDTAHRDPKALLIFAGFLLAAFLFEWIYPRLSGRPRQNPRRRAAANLQE